MKIIKTSQIDEESDDNSNNNSQVKKLEGVVKVENDVGS